MHSNESTKLIKKIIIKSMTRKVSTRICRTYNQIHVFDINDHNGQGCKGFEPALLFSAEELKQIELIAQPERHFSN